MTQDAITIQLPSLIHRIGGAQAKLVKQAAKECACELKRIRRSRNWQLTGNPDDLIRVVQNLKSAVPDIKPYLFNKIEAEVIQHHITLEPTTDKLKRLIAENPAITLTELVQLTNCTLSEARIARFENELI